MEKEQFLSAITEYSSSINVMLSEEQKEMFYEYMNILLEWNQKINLTTIIKPEDIIIKHFIDSLTVLKYIKNEKINVIDIGTGAGLPGIPIKIANESNNVTLLENTMIECGFTPFPFEWWHFNDNDNYDTIYEMYE